MSNTSAGNQDFEGELGLDFKVNAAAGIVIKQLGAFDHQGNGLTGTQSGGIRVAVFNKATQAIVPGLDAVIIGNGDAFASNFRLKNISPVTLAPGDYVVVAKGYYSGELNGNQRLNPGGHYPLGDNGGGAINYLTTTFWGTAGSGFNYPVNSVNTGTPTSFLAGTFVFSTSISAPAGTLVTITVKDHNGNTKTATATVFVQDPLGVCTSTQPVTQMAPGLPGLNAIDLGSTKRLTVFPNPTNGNFTVQLSDLKASKATIQIIHSNSSVVQEKTVNLTGKTATLTVPFNLTKEAAGMYFVKVISSEGVLTARVVVQR